MVAHRLLQLPAQFGRRSALAMLLLGLLFTTTFSTTLTPLVAAPPASNWWKELLNQVNALRAEEENAPLQLAPKLNQAAQRHAEHMASTGKFAHEEIGDGTIPERLAMAQYEYRNFGENIAWGPADAAGAMRLWIASPPHLKNLHGPFTEIGLGRAVATDGKIYWVTVFGTPR